MHIMLSDCLILTYLHEILLFLNMSVSHITAYVGIDYLHLVLT